MQLSISTIATNEKRQVIDITDRVSGQVADGDGIAVVSVQHTTAAITTADLDPGTDLDLLDALEALLPQKKWRHPHDPSHAPDHLLASIIGPSVVIPVCDGKLLLGTWQRIILLEFDGPRERQLTVTIV